VKNDEKECDKKFDASEVDLESLGLESCSDCECAVERARKVVNSLLVDAAACAADITISRGRGHLEVWLHADEDEKLFELNQDAFSPIASYLADLRDGQLIEFESGPGMLTRFWCDIDAEEREVTIVNQGDLGEGIRMTLDLPTVVVDEIESIARLRNISVGELVERACQMAGDSIQTACICPEMGNAIERCYLDFFVSDETYDRIRERAMNLEINEPDVVLRSLILTRDCLNRPN